MKYMQLCQSVFGSFVLICLLSATSAYAQTPQTKGKEGKAAERAAYQRRMLADPNTGKIPEKATLKELKFMAAGRAKHKTSRRGNNQRQTVARWQPRGPYNIGGRTRALAIDRTNEQVILAGASTGGMWRSQDDGQTWTKVTGVSTHQSVSAIVQDPRPNQGNIWYYGTGSSSSLGIGGNFYSGKGIYKSVDGGLTWVLLTNTDSFNNGNFNLVHKMAADNQGRVFAATYNGVYRSADEGETWTKVLGDRLGRFDWTNVQVATDGSIYASLSTWNFNNNNGSPALNTNGGFFRSVDGGTSWTRLQFAAPYDRLVVKRASIAIAPSDENQVYFFLNVRDTLANDANAVNIETRGANSHHQFVLLRYTQANDHAQGNDTLQIALEDFTGRLPHWSNTANGKLNSQFGVNQLLKVHPSRSNVLFVGDINLTRVILNLNPHRIGGYHPQFENNLLGRYPNHHPDNHDLVFYPSNPDRMLSAHDGGISRTENNQANIFSNSNTPVTWVELNQGYSTTEAYAVAIDRFTANDEQMLAGFQDRGKWYTNQNDPQEAWQEEAWGADGTYQAIVSGSNVRYMGTQNGKVMRWEGDPAGRTQVRGGNFVQPTGNGRLFIHPFILDKNDERIMYYPVGSVMLRNLRVDTIHNTNSNGTDKGWALIGGTANNQQITALDVSKDNDANVLYFGTNNGKVFRINHANDTARASNAIDLSINKGLPNGYVSSIAVDPKNADNVLITYSNYGINSIFYTRNGGESWIHVGGNLDINPDNGTSDKNGPSVRWAEIHRPATGGVIYLVGTSVGLYTSELFNGNQTEWHQESALNIGNSVVTMVEARSSDNLVAVATFGSGLYSANITSTIQAAGCNAPSHIVANYVGATIASLQWQYAPSVAGYTVRHRIKGSSKWNYKTTHWNGTSFFGLKEGSTYEMQVKTNCTTEELYTPAFEFATAPSWSDRIMITEVQMNSMTHKTPDFTQEYNDFTYMSAHAIQGKTTPIQINHHSTLKQTAYAKVWVDFNQDGDFADKGEAVLSTQLQANTATSFLGEVNVPKNARLGETNMRIIVSNQPFAASMNTGTNGEIEDYSINIVAASRNTFGIGSSALSNNSSLLYPNPASAGDDVNIKLSLRENERAILALYNAQGIRVAETNLATFKTQNLPTGQYFVRVLINGKLKETLPLIIR